MWRFLYWITTPLDIVRHPLHLYYTLYFVFSMLGIWHPYVFCVHLLDGEASSPSSSHTSSQSLSCKRFLLYAMPSCRYRMSFLLSHILAKPLV